MTAHLLIEIAEPSWRAVLPNLEPLAQETIEAALVAASTDAATRQMEIGLTCTNDTAMQALNLAWRGQDKSTNVLSFPAAGPRNAPARAPVPLGDIVLALETIRHEAAREDKPVASHVRHLLVHGVLHLLGYDHETEAEAEAMEALEVKILSTLGVANPYI